MHAVLSLSSNATPLVSTAQSSGAAKSMKAFPNACHKLRDRILASKVARAISTTGYAQLDGIEVQSLDGLVTLSGGISSPYLRGIAQQAAQNVAGVRDVLCQTPCMQQEPARILSLTR